MRDFKQEMRDYGMPEEAIELAEDISIILGKSFEEVVQTKHTELLELVVKKHVELLESVSQLISGLKEEQQ